MKKQITIMIILGVLLVLALVLALGYIVIDKFQAARQEEAMQIFQQGVQVGYEQAVLQLIQQALTCQTVPVYAGNTTINVIAVECLQGTK